MRWLAPERSERAARSSSCTRAWARCRCGRTFPQRLCDAAGVRGLVYSRPGYGRSTPRAPTRPGTSTSCTGRRTRCCRRCSRRWTSMPTHDKPWLFGHSDGGSIALLYAARVPAARRRRRSCWRRTSSSRTCRCTASSKARDAYLEHRPARSAWRSTTTTPTRPSGAGTASGCIRRFRQWTIEDEIARHPLPAARGPGPGRRVRHARADPRHRTPRAADRTAGAARLRAFPAPRPARSGDRRRHTIHPLDTLNGDRP